MDGAQEEDEVDTCLSKIGNPRTFEQKVWWLILCRACLSLLPPKEHKVDYNLQEEKKQKLTVSLSFIAGAWDPAAKADSMGYTCTTNPTLKTWGRETQRLPCTETFHICWTYFSLRAKRTLGYVLAIPVLWGYTSHPCFVYFANNKNPSTTCYWVLWILYRVKYYPEPHGMVAEMGVQLQTACSPACSFNHPAQTPRRTSVTAMTSSLHLLSKLSLMSTQYL